MVCRGAAAQPPPAHLLTAKAIHMNPLYGDRRTTLIFVGPALLVYSAIIMVPVFWSLGYTFTQGNAITGFEFVGIDNYIQLLGDSKVWNSLLFTLKYAVVLTIGQVLLGYLLSLAYVFVLRRSSTFIRTLVFFPVVLPTVAVALLFQQLFAIAPQNGLVNSLINAIGGESVDWLGSGTTAFLVIVIMDLWRSMGFYGVLLYAGILDIPEEVLESARMDGASGWTLVRQIVLPLSLPGLDLGVGLLDQRNTEGVRQRPRADQRRPRHGHDAADHLHVPDIVQLRPIRLRQHHRLPPHARVPRRDPRHHPREQTRPHQGVKATIMTIAPPSSAQTTACAQTTPRPRRARRNRLFARLPALLARSLPRS